MSSQRPCISVACTGSHPLCNSFRSVAWTGQRRDRAKSVATQVIPLRAEHRVEKKEYEQKKKEDRRRPEPGSLGQIVRGGGKILRRYNNSKFWGASFLKTVAPLCSTGWPRRALLSVDSGYFCSTMVGWREKIQEYARRIRPVALYGLVTVTWNAEVSNQLRVWEHTMLRRMCRVAWRKDE